MKKVIAMLHEIDEKDLNDVLKMLKEALNSVENNYIEQSYARVTAGVQNPENSFTCELYHQIKMLQHSNRYSFFSNLRLNFDIGKKTYQINRRNSCLSNFYREQIRPDLVLHKEQNNLDEQKLICEIKTNRNLQFEDFVIDLQKLIYYKVSKLKFENAIFIYSGDIDKIERYLSKLMKTNEALLNCLINHEIRIAVRKNINKSGKWSICSIDIK